MKSLPTKLIITDCAAASDGGSLVLIAASPEDAEISIHLDWSLASQETGTTQLYVNDAAVPKSSRMELSWLDLLSNAEVNYRFGNPNEALRNSVNTLLRNSVNEVISRVGSEAYQQGIRRK